MARTINPDTRIHLQNLGLSFLGSILATGVLWFLGMAPLGWLLQLVILFALLYFVIRYFRFKRNIGFKTMWLPNSKKPLMYQMEQARQDYIAMGVTLHSMLQTTGVGVDIERFATEMPKSLKIRLLLLNPQSPFFAERVTAAHPAASDPDQVIASKRDQQRDLINRVRSAFGDSVDIRYYNDFPAWWIQLIDERTIYFATQTRDSHIGQTYPFGFKLTKAYDSELFWTISAMLESLWKHGTPAIANQLIND